MWTTYIFYRLEESYPRKQLETIEHLLYFGLYGNTNTVSSIQLILVYTESFSSATAI